MNFTTTPDSTTLTSNFTPSPTSLQDTRITRLDDIHKRSSFYARRLSEALAEIHSDAHKEQVLALRQLYQDDKKAYSEMKKSLPAFVFSGTFNHKVVNADFAKASGMMVLDVDHLSEKSLSQESIKARLANDNSVVAVFTSPSGDGVKILVHIPEIKNDACYKAIFIKLQAYFIQRHGVEIDPSGKDIARLCFVSYDPEIYINYHASVIDLTGFDYPAYHASPIDLSKAGDPILEGSRNDTLFYVASSLRGKGWNEEEIRKHLTIINNVRCIPTLEEDEIGGVAASVMRYEPNNEDGLEVTEVALSELFQRQSDGTIRYLTSRGCFVVWDGKQWCVDEHGTLIVGKVRDFCFYLRENMRDWKPYQHEAVRKLTKRLRSERGESILIKLLKTRPGMPINLEDFDKNPYLLQVANGVVDLRTGSFQPAKMEDYCLKSSPVTYVPGADCPEFKKLLLWAMGDNQECVDFLQRLFGYTSMGHAQEEILPIFCGNGANGKSTLREVMRLVLGEYAVTAPPNFLVERKNGAQTNDIAMLIGARAVFVSETGDGDKLAESIVKYLCQQEPVSARFHYQEFSTFKPQFTCLLATNHRPIVRGSDQGIWRRIKLIPFDQTINPEDINVHYVDEKLRPELSGILNWMIAGAVAYNQIGLAIPDVIRECTEEYRENSDYLKQFIADCLEHKAGSDVTNAELTVALTKWYHRTYGEDVPKYVNMRNLGKALKECGYENRKSNGIRGYRDIAIAQYVSKCM